MSDLQPHGLVECEELLEGAPRIAIAVTDAGHVPAQIVTTAKAAGFDNLVFAMKKQ